MMRNSIIILLLSICVGSALALPVQTVGKAVQVVNGLDTLLIFDGEPALEAAEELDWTWFYADGTSKSQTKSTTCDVVESGCRVEVRRTGESDLLGEFVVFNYNDYLPVISGLEVEPRCNQTLVTPVGTIPQMTYPTRLGASRTYTRTCSLSFINLGWNGEQWTDSMIVCDSLPLAIAPFELPPFYRETQFAMAFESLAVELGILPQLDSVLSDYIAPIAVGTHPTTVVTTRGDNLENEHERPIDPKMDPVKGSAPLNVLFLSNPTPGAEFFDWKIYKSENLLAARTDEQQRYVFSDYGTYRVVVRVSNSQCPCPAGLDGCVPDSTEFIVTVSSSMLRVPNVFTPNGDGQNDEFRVLYRSLREYHIDIFNRWGHLVYSSDDPAKGWDGTVGGRPVAEGAYYYVIRAMGTDARKDASYGTKMGYQRKIKSNDESVLGVYRLSGDINLIRGK